MKSIDADADRDAATATADVPSRARVSLELAVIVALAVVFLAVFQTRPGFVDVVLGLVAVGLIGLGTARSRSLWARHPVRYADARTCRRKAAQWTAAFTLPVATAFMAVGAYVGYSTGGGEGAIARVANWHLAAALLLYFPWALLQQFVFQFFLLGRLLHLLPPPAAVVATALAFSAVHFPRAPVMAGTLAAGIVWAVLYRRYRSLLPLAISHAMLGATLHYWVFGRDLLARWLSG